jgi:dTDP-4-dehydrorhamnose reductase
MAAAVKRLLITGGSSYLGQHLVPLATGQYDVRYTYFQGDPLDLESGTQLDVRDAGAVRRLILSYEPQAVIHLAGSNRSADMENVIRQGTTNVVAAVEEAGIRLVHMSTDVVFDGRHPPYSEVDRPTPLHAYGRAKADAEAIVSDFADQAIIRTSLIYGLTVMDRGTEWMAAALRQGQPVMLFDDQMRQPVWAETLSLACLELANSDYRGVLNVAGGQSMSRAEFGLKMLDWWGIEERESLSLGPGDPKWPADTRMDLSLAEELLETRLLGVDEVIELHRA